MKLMRIGACLAVLFFGIPVAMAQSPAAVAGNNANGIVSLTVNRSGGTSVLRIGLRQPLAAPISSFSIANPARIVFDFPATENALRYSSKAVNEGGLRSLNLVQAGDRSRLVLNLDKMTHFETRQEGNFLFISLADAVSGVASTSSSAVQHFAGSGKDEVHSLRDVKFQRNADGAGRVMIELSATDTEIDIRPKGSALVVSLKKTHLPDALRRKLDVIDFATPVTAVNTSANGDDVIVEILPKGVWDHTAFQSDNQLIVEVRPVKEDPNKLVQGTGYRGEKISLNFQNIPLRELLHVFADISELNLIINDSVQGNLSLRLNDVPWDQALDIVLGQKGLTKSLEGKVLWIAPSDEMEKRFQQIEMSKRAEQSKLRIIREIIQLNYQKADDMLRLIKGQEVGVEKTLSSGGQTTTNTFIMENRKGKLLSEVGYNNSTSDKESNILLIVDYAPIVDEVKDFIALIDKPKRQVLIEARIVEAEDSFSSSIGVRLGTNDLKGGAVGHSLGGTSGRYSIGNSYAQNMTNTGQAAVDLGVLTDGTNVNLPASGVGGANPGLLSFSLFNSAKTMFLNLELSALEFDGRGKVVSSPRVVTADKEKAIIKHGTEIPYQVASSSGATSVQFKDAVLSLEATPFITPDNKVRMKLKVNKDTPNLEIRTGAGLAIDKKEVTTEVLVENGGTLVIGGIYQQTITNKNSRVPVLGDMPYLGFLFKQNTKEDKRAELLIFITPKIVSDQLGVQ